ncbi:MAG: N-acetyltransferase family protein [Planctomycetota bacterium]
MDGEIHVREATPEDARAISEVQVAGWRSAYRGIVPDAMLDELDVEAGAERRRQGMLRGAARGVVNHVLELDGRIVAWAASGPWRGVEDHEVPGLFELYAIYVEPSRIGTGLGRRLWLAVLEGLPARGAERLRLWTFVENARARRFYERAGFHEDPTVPREQHEDTGALKLCYVRALPDVGPHK